MARRTLRTKQRRRPRFRLRVPPWAPVVVVVVVVTAVIGLFFVVRETAAQPRIGDHIHAAMDIYVCGQHEPKLPQFEAGIHSHGDGLYHMHPQVTSEEGPGVPVGVGVP